MKLDRIVVAIDFSPESQQALEQAMIIARKSGAELTLLHVCGVPDHHPLHPTRTGELPDAMKPSLNLYEDMLREQLREVRVQLDDLSDRNSGQGVQLSHVLREGLPDVAIVEAATELHADLIVTGSHGRHGLTHFFLGSIAERVVRLAHVPVLVARTGIVRGGFDRILVPVDFSPLGDRVLGCALAVATPGAQIDLVHAWEMSALGPQALMPLKAAQDLVQPLKDSLQASIVEQAQQLMARHARPGITLAFHPVEGRPNEVIDHWVKEHPTSLVVTGSHGRRGLRRFILGSVAEATVRHVKCSVLVVH